MQRICSGECPYLKDTHKINVEYAYILMTGTNASNYKKNGFACSHSHKCECDDLCPIYQNAPKTLP